jgi:hypothetical protein
MSEKGKNSEIVHNGERYHIQTESWAPVENALVTQIFKGGQVVLKTKVQSYGPLEDHEVNSAHEKAIEEFKKLLI